MKKLLLIFSILLAMVNYAKADNFVTDVMVIGGTRAETNNLKAQYQSQGWTVVDQDLNQGAGGDYIYLLYKTDTDANPDATFITYFTWFGFYTEGVMNPSGITYYPVAYAGGSQFVASQGNLNSGTTSGCPLYLYYTKDANGGTDNPHLVKSITFNSNSEGAMPNIDLNFECGGNAPEIYMHPDITQGWVFWQGNDTECIILAYDGPKAWITSYTVPTTHDGLNVIAADVFNGFINLETLIFPYESHVTDMPSMQGCTNLQHVNVRLNNNVYQDDTPLSMTSIPDYAFYGTAVTTIILRAVTNVGDYAFEGCNLSSITFNQSNVQIGNRAFANISRNCTVTYSGSVDDWSPNAYVYSPNLVVNASDGSCGWCGGAGGTSENYLYWTLDNATGHLNIDWLWQGSPEQQVISSHNWNNNNVHSLTLNHVYGIGEDAFSGYTNLTSVTIPNSVTSIGQYAFSGCIGLTSVTIPNSVTVIGDNAFENCSSLTSVTIPNSVTSIRYCAFQGCTGLTSVTIPNSVTTIDWHVFYGCTGLTSVNIPNSVTSIDELAFGGCSNITSVNINSNAILSESSSLKNIFGSQVTNYTIGNDVTSIGEHAFYGCSGLTSITIPNSVTSIGVGAFNGCTGLTSVNIPNSVTSIGGSAFFDCTSLTSVTIGNSVTSIGEYTFYGCTGLTSVTIPNSVTSIEGYAFYICTGLTSVTIGNGVTSIGGNAFSGCSSLKDLYFDGTKTQWNNVTKGYEWNNGVHPDYMEHWRCTVTFNANGHGTAPAPQTNLWSNESKATQPTAPTESGYVFTGWYTDAQCTTLWDFNTRVVPDDMTLYAGWDLEVQGLQGSGTVEDPYLISNNWEWIWFAQSITNGTTYAGQTVKLTADIAATVMAGSHANSNYHAFSGTFDGDGHTITLALSGSGDGSALFSDLEGATLKNLKVQGFVATTGYRPATFAAFVSGNCTIRNCWSTVAVSSTRTNDWVDGGGFVGRVSSGATLNITDCAFHGSVTYDATAYSGGSMVGFTQSDATVNLTNCLYSPTALVLTLSAYNPHVFVSGDVRGNLTNCYYNAVAAASILENEGINASEMSNEELVAALGPNWRITDGLVVPKWIFTFTKAIAGYGTGNSGWYMIASPVGTVNLADVPQLFDNQYDLYYFDQTGGTNGKEWKNHKAHPEFTSLVNGQGYLYANSGNVTLAFTGVPYDGNGEVTLTKANGFRLSGWNLIGNPYTTAATLNKPFYRINASGLQLSAQVEANSSVAAMEGVFVQASIDNETATFTPIQPQLEGGHNTVPVLNINLTRNRGEAIDNAIVRFDDGQTLGKYMLHEDDSKLYFPQGGEDYAIANANNTGEMPLNFKASENGTYTLTVNVEGLELDYLHLIDNMTGNDVDLLALRPHSTGSGTEAQGPASYTFTAKTTDYESRFKLVFASSICGDANGDNETFAFFNNGNWIIANPSTGSGSATLQVIDLLGRQLSSQEIHSTFSIPHSTFAPGVYVLRLIDKEKVRTQKIVVE